MTDAALLDLWDRRGGELRRWGTVLLVILAHPRSPGLFELGFLLTLFGVGIRFWAAGQASGEVGAARGGAFALVRHPDLYGVFLLCVGIALVCTTWRHPFSMVPAWAFVAGLRLRLLPAMARRREESLRAEATEALLKYQAEVPAFCPKYLFYPAPVPWTVAFSTTRWQAASPFEQGLHKELGVVLLVAAILRFKMIYGL